MNSRDENLLNQLVDKMMEESNHNPRDYCFRYILNTYPKAAHDAFDFPGEYVDNLEVDVFTDDGRSLEMDCAQLVMPKGNINCKSTINVEHQTYPINDEKVETMYDYKLFLIYKTNIPSNSIVMTNMDLENEIIYCESHDQIFKLHLNVVTKEKISKRLTILNNKITNNHKLSQEEVMYFAYISIFLKEKDAKETMEKIAILFSRIKEIEPNLELDIHQILKKMIKFHFRDDLDKCRELLTMISKSIFQKNLDGLTYKERAEIRMKKLNQKLEEKDQQLEEKDQQLEKKDQQLEQTESENKKLKAELEKIKQQVKDE